MHILIFTKYYVWILIGFSLENISVKVCKVVITIKRIPTIVKAISLLEKSYMLFLEW